MSIVPASNLPLSLYLLNTSNNRNKRNNSSSSIHFTPRRNIHNHTHCQVVVVAVAVVVVVAVVVRPMLETSSLNARCWCRVQVMRRLGVEPTERKFLVLKSRVHWYSTPS